MDKLIEACIRGNFDDVQQLLETKKLDPAKKDGKGWSPLHYASQYGHEEIVSLLLEKGYNPEIRTHGDRSTSLHLACANGHAIVARHLLEQHVGAKPPPKNRDGESPLHLACKTGCVELVKTLLERFPETACALTLKGISPLGYAVSMAGEAQVAVANLLIRQVTGNPAIKGKFADFGTLFPSFDAKLSLDPPVKVFVTGDRQNGKSTLIRSLRAESLYDRFWGISYNVQDVDEHKVGLVPTDFRRSKFGRIVFYDLASGRDCIQTDIIRCEADIAQSVFVILIDFRNEREEMEDKMAFWMNFIYQLCAKYWSPQNKPNLAIVGSFADVIRPFRLANSHRLQMTNNAVIAMHKVLASRFTFLGRFSLDCRKAESPNLRLLRSTLKRKCEAIRPNGDELPSLCYILSSVLERELEELRFPAIQLSELAAKISEKFSSPQTTLFHLLPHEVEKLLPLCKALEERERVVLLKAKSTDSDKDIWIIHDLHSLVTMFNTIFRQLINAKGACQTSSWPAIMTRNDLKSQLSSITLSIDVLVQLLKKFKIGEALPSRDGSTTDLQEFYFPSLLPSPDFKQSHSNDPIQQWDPQDSRYSFGFAWSFIPAVDQECQFFLPHFLKLLLLQLLINRAHSDFDKYTVWSHGIHCSLRDQLEVYITHSIDSKAVTLNMRCKPGQELACLTFRNQFLKEIRDAKESTQQIKTNEVVIPLDGGEFPVQQPAGAARAFNVADFKQEMKENPPSHSLVATLFFLEPYLFITMLSEQHQNILINPKHASASVTEEFLASLADCFGEMWQGIAEQFEWKVETDTSTEGSDKHSENSDPPTDGKYLQYKDILEGLSSISIFQATGLKKAIEETKTVKNFAQHVQPSPSGSNKSLPPRILHRPPAQGWQQASQSDISSDPSDVHTESTTPTSPIRNSVANSIDSDLSVVSSDATQSETASIDSVKELQVSSTLKPKSQSDIPFIGPIVVLQCDSDGGVYNSKIHDIQIRIPKGACTIDQKINLEFGVTLHGPFTFPKEENVKAISPTVWLFVQKNASFNLPIELVIPHFVEYDGEFERSQRLAFYRAEKKLGREYQFRKVKNSESGIDAYSGTLRTKLSKNPYHLCIAGKVTQALISKSKYYLIKAMPKSTDGPLWKIHFYVTNHLLTSIEMTKEKVGDTYTLDSDPIPFNFAIGFEDAKRPKPSIEIDFERSLSGGWCLIPGGGTRKIEQQQVEFWNVGKKDMERKERRCYPYPPRFTVTIDGMRAKTDANAKFVFKGIMPDIEQEILLRALSHNDDAQSITFPVDNMSVAMTEKDTAQEVNGVTPEISRADKIFHERQVSTGSTASKIKPAESIDSIISVISLPAPGSHNLVWKRSRADPNRFSQSLERPPALDTGYHHILDKHLVTVTENLDVQSIRPYLRQARVISEQDYIELLKMRSENAKDQAEMLAYMIKRKGVEGFHKFLHILESTAQDNPGHEDIIRAIKNDPGYEQRIYPPIFESRYSSGDRIDLHDNK